MAQNVHIPITGAVKINVFDKSVYVDADCLLIKCLREQSDTTRNVRSSTDRTLDNHSILDTVEARSNSLCVLIDVGSQ